MSQEAERTAAPLTERLRALRDALQTGLVERDVAIRLALIAALAGEHLLLLGPPGTGKSLVARRVHLAFAGGAWFERLLTRFTVPEELFGPLSIKGLEEDRYERLTASYLPTASIAFLDEIFKANSAILNSLLTLLNEREFDNGAVRVRTPLVAVVGASNELPEGAELDALFDRFLLRLHVGPVSKDSFGALLGLRGVSTPEILDDLRLTRSELEDLQKAADDVAVPDDVVTLLTTLRDWCTAEGIPVSDRRWRKIVKLLQVSALTNGRRTVSIWDCWLLQHCIWARPEDREKVFAWYSERVGTSQAMDPARLTRMVVAREAQLERDRQSRSQAHDSDGRLLYLGPGGVRTPARMGRTQQQRSGQPLYLAPAEAVRPGRMHYSQVAFDRSNAQAGYTEAELNELSVLVRHTHVQFQHWGERARYLGNSSNWMSNEAELPPALEPSRHKPIYVENTLREIDSLLADVEVYRAALDRHVASLEADIRSHLWVTKDFAAPALRVLQTTRREVDTLRDRAEAIRKGYELLPRDEVEILTAPAGDAVTVQQPVGP